MTPLQQFTRMLSPDYELPTISLAQGSDSTYQIKGDVSFTYSEDCPILPINISQSSTFRSLDPSGVCHDLLGHPWLVHGRYSLRMQALRTLLHSPSIVLGSMFVHCPLITKFDHAPRTITGDLHVSYVSDWSGVQETALRHTELGGKIHRAVNILGFALIPGIKEVVCHQPLPNLGAHILPLLHFDVTHGDIIRFQDELLEAGFPEKARL